MNNIKKIKINQKKLMIIILKIIIINLIKKIMIKNKIKNQSNLIVRTNFKKQKIELILQKAILIINFKKLAKKMMLMILK